ncbi:amidohydrolase family protein [Plantactinospora sp. B5E13]|uniref:amidohydrolase family protein n=1 Tax=unclassified Plantactinospora TaxID=2631981 RepID=UPI00325D0074
MLTAPPRSLPRAPHVAPPPGATDSHAHAFGPFATYPPGPSGYPVPETPSARYLEMLDTVGLSRGVLVQPGPYAQDHAVLLDGLRAAGGRLVGVGVARPDISDRTLDRLAEAGVRGLRFIEPRLPATSAPPGSVGVTALEAFAPRLAELGWHAQLWAGAADCARWGTVLAERGVPVVFDHLAQPDVEAGVDAPAFRQVRALVAAGVAWVKIPVCRVGTAANGFTEARPFHDALLETNPDRLLWASDWPFVRLDHQVPDVGELLDLFRRWTPGPEWERILVHNPARLYGFPDLGAA